MGMSLLSFLFGRNKPTAPQAKQRLQTVLASERSARSARSPRKPDYLPALQREVFGVVSKYAKVHPRDIKLRFDRERNGEVIRVKIELRQSRI